MTSPGRHRLAPRGLLSAFLGVLACVVVATPVWAFVSRSTHVEVVPVVSGPSEGSYRLTFGSSTATCPAGQHVLFGGFDNGATGMRRAASNRWTVDGFNVGINLVGQQNSPLSLYSMAYCGRGPVPSKATSTVEIRYRSGRAPSGSATARCPAGTVVVAGGFATTPNTVVFVTGLERVAADLWRVSAYLFLTTHTALTAIAYCGPGPAPKLVSQTVTTFNHRGAGLARATCPVGRQLVFGGARVTGGVDIALRTLRVPAKTKNTWAVTGYPGGARAELTALAYCR